MLIVDDEPDVLETLEDLLPMCKVEKASSFDEAKGLLERRDFDLALLDIMGVDGYRLLDIAKERGVTPVMLTAHALSLEDLEKSRAQGAASYVPKDRMEDITIYLKDVLEANEAGKSSWRRLFDRLGAYFEGKFGSEWKGADFD